MAKSTKRVNREMKRVRSNAKVKLNSFSLLLIFVLVLSVSGYVGYWLSKPQAEIFHKYLVGDFRDHTDDDSGPRVVTTNPSSGNLQ